MELRFLTEEAYNKLRTSINANFQLYDDSEPWLKDYFQSTNYYEASSISIGKFSPSIPDQNLTDKEKSENDLINARLIYESYKNLTRYQASLSRFWTYLCHDNPECYTYIKRRFMIKPGSTTIETRFFGSTISKLIVDNALSRLWWSAHLTHDSQQADPYALTKVLFTNQTIMTDVLDTKNRNNPNRLRGFLLAIKDFVDSVGESGLVKIVRECNKYLNQYAAITSLETLEVDDIRYLVLKQMERIQNHRENS